MSSLIICLVSLLSIFAITEQASTSLSDIEKILKNLAAQTDPKHRSKNLQYGPNYSKLGFQQQQNRYKSNLDSLEAQDRGLLYQLNSARIQKQLEDDLEQALRFESDRICKATGRCGCSGGRCGKPYRSKDSTVDDVEQILKEVNEQLYRSQNQNSQSDLDRQQRYNDRRQRHRDRDQDQYERRQRYEENRQQFGQRQQFEQRLQFGQRQRQQSGQRQRYEQQQSRQQQRYDERQQEYDDRRQEQDDRRQRRERYEEQRQDFDDQRQEYDDRRQQYEYEEEDDKDQTLDRKIKKYNTNDDFDVIVLEVPDKDTSNRNDDLKIVDVRELGLRDLLQQ